MTTSTAQNLTISKRAETAFVLLASVFWVIMVRRYLTGDAILDDDARSYYDHIKFYIDNVRSGVFPLWDPVWFCGAANNFFLQRMGCFNPCLGILGILNAIGIPFTPAYLIYMALYYLLGCWGFYLLAKNVLKDTVGSFTAFILLLFSSLGTRLFDSYLVLLFTPIVWFFYFLVSFGRRPSRSSFVGMILALLIIFTTYIPFYFLLIFVSFAFFYLLFYGGRLPALTRQSWRFIRGNKILTGICIFVLLVSLVPGYLFFKTSAGKSEFVMPARNTNKTEQSVLAVERQDKNTNSWSITEEIFFARYYYTDLTLTKFAILYIPLLAYIIILLGCVAGTNRRMLFVFAWGVGLFLVCSPTVSPLYSFLYNHLFFFKYFRNLHFLLWIALLPIFCLFIGAQLQSVLQWRSSSRRGQWAALGYVCVVHALVVWYLHHSYNPLATTYAAVLLSFIFFVVSLLGGHGRLSRYILMLLLLAAAVEPLEVYHHMSYNTKQKQPLYIYLYDYVDLKFHYTRMDNDVDMALNTDPAQGSFVPSAGPHQRTIQPSTSIYYASKWYSYLVGNIDYYVIQKYRKHRFILYDQTVPFSEETGDFLVLETALAENKNTAFVSSSDPQVLGTKSSGRHSYYAQPVEGDSQVFKVVYYDVNRIRIETDFTEPKFIVYNDSFYSQWQASIDGHKEPIIRSNIAFKGLWVPAGKHSVEFTFGSWSMWVIYLFLFISCSAIFVAVFVFSILDAKKNKNNEAIVHD